MGSEYRKQKMFHYSRWGGSVIVIETHGINLILRMNELPVSDELPYILQEGLYKYSKGYLDITFLRNVT